MRLSEMGPGRDDAPLPAEVEAELSALDAALAGDDVPAGMEGLEALVSDLRAERSTPESEFGDALDRWAAAGFPRGRRPGLSIKATASDAGGRFRLFLDSLTPRKLAYAGGAAATLVVLVVGVSQIDFDSERKRPTIRAAARATTRGGRDRAEAESETRLRCRPSTRRDGRGQRHSEMSERTSHSRKPAPPAARTSVRSSATRR